MWDFGRSGIQVNQVYCSLEPFEEHVEMRWIRVGQLSFQDGMAHVQVQDMMEVVRIREELLEEVRFVYLDIWVTTNNQEEVRKAMY